MAKTIDIQALKHKMTVEYPRIHQMNQNKLKNDKELLLASKLQQSGTLNDKISALMLRVKKSFSPGRYCDFESLDGILSFAGKKSRYHSQPGVEALSELFTDLLIQEDKLQPFSKIDDPKRAKEFYINDCIKQKYLSFITILKEHTQDSVEHHRKIAIRTLTELALAKAEERESILDAIVNKLGDSATSIPTCVVLECNKIIKKNRHILPSLLDSLSRFILRKNNPSLFYAIVLLNSIKLRPGENKYISQVIKLCLKIFPQIVENYTNKGNKSIALLLKSINKLFPLYTEKENVFKDELHELYRLTHLQSNQNIQLQALKFVFNIEKASGFVSERFFRSFYSFILPQPSFLSLGYESLTILIHCLYQALKEDHNIPRVRAFIKRILQVCLISEPSTVLGFLLLISELFEVHSSLYLMIKEAPYEDPEEVYDDAPDSDEEPPPAANKEIPLMYDPMKREPEYSNSEYTGLFELLVLQCHTHPTVSAWATKLLNRERIEYESDPILDFSLSNFLDRLTFRTPKQKDNSKKRRSLREAPANTKDFKMLEIVREEEMYLQKYFLLKKEEEKEIELPVKNPRPSVFADPDDLDLDY